MQIKGNVVDVVNERIFPGIVTIENGKIASVDETNERYDDYILPGFVDDHIHIESSMLTPSRFAEAVVPHGTVAVVADPHEIANVLGMSGIDYMRQDAKQTPLKVFFTAPSCVPATEFETNGAKLTSKDIEKLLKQDDIVALGEMMDFPGVINKQRDVMEKIDAAKRTGKPIDGHCPGLTGADLKSYFSAGISTDHECTAIEEAREKAMLGMKIMIREGSSAKNMDALIPLAREFECFLVSDDKHPEDLVKGHVDLMLKKAAQSIEPIKAIKMVTINPVKHYKLNVGLLQKGDPADLVIVDNLKEFNVKETWINGNKVADSSALFTANPLEGENTIHAKEKKPEDFVIKTNEKQVKVNAIGVIENQLQTRKEIVEMDSKDGVVQSIADVLKVAVVERYGHNRIGLGFVSGFSLKGAIASSVSHDSHNIIVVGNNDDDMALAVNTVKKIGGGIVAAGDSLQVLELPVAGLMSRAPVNEVNDRLSEIHAAVKEMGCNLSAPFMTMSFLALPVIPEIRLTDKGLFDVSSFKFIDLFVK